MLTGRRSRRGRSSRRGRRRDQPLFLLMAPHCRSMRRARLLPGQASSPPALATSLTPAPPTWCGYGRASGNAQAARTARAQSWLHALAWTG